LSTLHGAEPFWGGKVIVGGVLSAAIMMVCLKVDLLPAKSVAVHVRVKVPAKQVSGRVVSMNVVLNDVQLSAIGIIGGANGISATEAKYKVSPIPVKLKTGGVLSTNLIKNSKE